MRVGVYTEQISDFLSQKKQILALEKNLRANQFGNSDVVLRQH